jgi:hypothetical protein
MKNIGYLITDIFRDFVLILLVGVNIGFQLLVAIQMCIHISTIANQCRMVDIYTFGIIAETIAMILTTISIVYVYCVRRLKCDPFLSILTLFAISWLIYAGIGIWKSYLLCKKETYPFIASLVILGLDACIGIILLLAGSHHSIRFRKKQISFIDEPPEFIRSYEIPRLDNNTNFTYYDRNLLNSRSEPAISNDNLTPIWSVPNNYNWQQSSTNTFSSISNSWDE